MSELLLNTIRKHISLSEADAELLTASVQVRKIRRNQLLAEPPIPAAYEHFILKGCCRQYYLDSNGVEHTLGFAAEGWWMTDLDSFFTGQPAKYHVECLEDGEVLILKKEVLDELFLRIPALNIYFRILYQNAITALDERLLNVLSTKADERYMRFMQKYPELQNRLSQYQIASYLGVTPEFFSRMKAKLSIRR
jgi:CRP-like cAMP-binding protein